MGERHVVKLGGSLLDLPDLATRFERWRAGQSVIVVNGGGDAADLVRAHCARYGIDDATGHDLAMQAMSFNTRLLLTLLPHAQLVARWEEVRDEVPVQIIDAWPLLRDEPLPKRWAFTSDSISAFVAHRLSARLTLLKSTLEGAELVDACFAQASAGLSSVQIVNLRDAAFPSRERPATP